MSVDLMNQNNCEMKLHTNINFIVVYLMNNIVRNDLKVADLVKSQMFAIFRL